MRGGANAGEPRSVALGSAFQSQTGSNFNCSSGFFPGAELALGGSARFATRGSVFAMASASGGIPGGCDASVGAPARPFLGSGYGLHAGVSFDVGVGGGGGSSTVAAR